jgi:hypothetical protein
VRLSSPLDYAALLEEVFQPAGAIRIRAA